MAEKPKIQMIASIAGDGFSWAPDQELVVGEDIDEARAIAFMTLPAGEPRAKPVNDAALALLAPRNETEPPKQDEEEAKRAAEAETATSTAAEKRETATDKRKSGRGKKQVEPPKEELPTEEPPATEEPPQSAATPEPHEDPRWEE